MTVEHKPTTKRTLYLLGCCIDGLEIALNMVIEASVINKTYTHLGVEKGFDYMLYEENFGCSKYIMDEIHYIVDLLPDSEESKRIRENNRRELSLLNFVRFELKKSLNGMVQNKSKLEAALSMYDALSQLNLDEEGFRYKFTIEDHILNLMDISDATTGFLQPAIKKAFEIRKYRIAKLQEV